MLSPLPASAQVYKWVAEDGSVFYSDRPQPGAEEVDLPDIQTIDAGPSLHLNQKREAEDVLFSYNFLEIAAPKDNETLRDNGGVVSVRLSLSPGLQDGHTIDIVMNGKSIGGGGRSTYATLTNVDRGSHTVVATVSDKNGKVVIQSGSVTFHLKRTSIAVKSGGG